MSPAQQDKDLRMSFEVAEIQVLLQRGGLQISAGLEQGTALAREMAQMRVRGLDRVHRA
jgi:hypothetical protein